MGDMISIVHDHFCYTRFQQERTEMNKCQFVETTFYVKNKDIFSCSDDLAGIDEKIWHNVKNMCGYFLTHEPFFFPF